MSFWPAGFDCRAANVAVFDLVNINTTEGDFGFLLGADGVFTDVNGKIWHGSTLLAAGTIESALNGIAPSGQMTFSYFQDPDQPDVIAEFHALGADYVRGRPVTFWRQPFNDISEMYAPVFAPILSVTRRATSLTYGLTGAQDRSITLSFESIGDPRNTSRGTEYSVAGHEILIGEPNPSLEFMPTDTFEEEPLFG